MGRLGAPQVGEYPGHLHAGTGKMPALPGGDMGTGGTPFVSTSYARRQPGAQAVRPYSPLTTHHSPASAYARTVVAIVRNDALVQMRTRETLLAGIIFALLVVIVFAFALNLGPAEARIVAPGLLWSTLALAGLFALGRSFASEHERGSLDGLLLAPVDPTAVYAGKLLSTVAFMVVTLAVALPAFTVLLGVELLTWALVITGILALLGFAAAGTLFAALALSGRARDVLLPALFLPLAIPVVLTATGATLPGAGSSAANAIGVLVACDALYVTAAILLFGYTVEE